MQSSNFYCDLHSMYGYKAADQALLVIGEAT